MSTRGFKVGVRLGERKGNLGFTLVELLAVLAIILVLMSFLLPAVLATRAKARETKCISNHKQIALAWLNYSGDFNGRLVPNPDSLRYQAPGWVFGNLGLETVAENREIMEHPGLSLLAPYVVNVDIYKCPSDESEFVRSVGMNCRLNPTRYDGDPAWIGGKGERYKTYRKLSDVDLPSRILAILDERSDTINDSYFVIDMSNTGDPEGFGPDRSSHTVVDVPGDYHSNGMMSSYVDGHAERHGWQDYFRRVKKGMHRRQSKPGEVDVKWLQDHCTVLKQ